MVHAEVDEYVRMRPPKVVEAKKETFGLKQLICHSRTQMLSTHCVSVFLFNADETEINGKGGAPGS